ncbi:hypothetical protein FISHEDRAFT_36785 [Fistulina hepatica ATCC 64428]|uniref:Fe2OG dioxygenase domain-containing protein n=1 Tax=Fistulina hepatica ATCC 64428 TaxID=1128425 RepID=A0A0D7AJW5_9AGAR|nr:hypothetical protein FISHEDRAFT_36785 [Fistulina hepatica ATCC 64428]
MSAARTALDAVYYIPHFVTIEEEEYLIRKIQGSPLHAWKQLKNRSNGIISGGELTPRNVLIPKPFPSYVENFPPLISRVTATHAFEGSPHHAPNHILMNEYLPGQGIMPHEDGGAYYPVVATLSLGSHALFHYYQYYQEGSPDVSDRRDTAATSIDPNPVATLLLEPRSLVITTGSLYKCHLHGIEERTNDQITLDGRLADLGVAIDNWNQLGSEQWKCRRDSEAVVPRTTRYSLTCRDIPKVAAVAAGSLLGAMRR